jgi:hypothetical protein
MKLAKLGLFLISCVLAFGQETPASAEKPSPEVDKALRSRVGEFYQAFVEGKFRKAYLLVSEDSQDAFMESSKDQYQGCEIIKVDFTDNLTKATVLERCNGMMHWHGTNLPTIVPLTTHWKLQNGDWDWYYIRPTEVMTPWGIAIIRPEDQTSSPVTKPVIPDGKAMAATIFTGVKVDKDNVTLHAWETSKDVVHLHNGMPGSVDLQIDVPKQPGLKVRADKTTLNQNEEATISFEYRLDDAEVLCGDCAKKVHGTAVVQIHIVPTGKIFPIQVSFQLPPEGYQSAATEPPKAKKKK